MARDLLFGSLSNPPPHLYRHDLESFLYILVWAALHYDFKLGVRLPTPECIQIWDSSMQSARNAKQSMITSMYTRDMILSHVQPQSQDRLVPWIISLADLFADGGYAEWHARDNPEWDKKTLGGWITFQKFMEALGREPRQLRPPQVDSATL
ncbi:hypothetical protein H0H81_011370 [Sphagnurus paluster]|uniref:Fungal-type protein kinase domain-containing protein n=1 Tax=Sphagnurus paluster TaxID=117069 RepID=A0A9P7FQJ7_9AGAR|nr:hypothetical protein H0H81_011370 [Sphagnurus paluster]